MPASDKVVAPRTKKKVRFQQKLESIREFSQYDEPLAVSKQSSYGKNITNNQHPIEQDINASSSQISEPSTSKIQFYSLSASTKYPVRLHEIQFRNDPASVTGRVLVENLAFEKQVFCRFTLDNWVTVSDTAAAYSHHGSASGTRHNIDWFEFSISLAEYTSYGRNKMFFCICYRVAGQEFWDNNNSNNFEVSFRIRKQPLNSARLMVESQDTEQSSAPVLIERNGFNAAQQVEALSATENSEGPSSRLFSTGTTRKDPPANISYSDKNHNILARKGALSQRYNFHAGLIGAGTKIYPEKRNERFPPFGMPSGNMRCGLLGEWNMMDAGKSPCAII